MTETSPAASSPISVGRKIALAVAAVLLLLLLTLSALSFMLSTQAGSRWALTHALKSLNSGGSLKIEVDNVEGTIFRGLSFGRARFVDASAIVDIQNLRTSWNPYSLLTGQLLLSDLWVSSLRIELTENQSVESEPELGLGGIENPLPISVILPRLRLERIEVVHQQQEHIARSLSLGAVLDDAGLHITALELTTEEVEIAGELVIGFSESLELSALLNWHYDLVSDSRVEKLAGRLELVGNLSALDITHQLESPQRILSSGNIVTGLAGGVFGFELSHSADTVALPIEGLSNYTLSDVALGTTGNLDEISLSLQSSLQYEQFPMVRLTMEATYSGSVLDVRAYNMVEADNTLSGAAIIDWSEIPRIDGSYILGLPSIESFIELPASLGLAGLAGSGSYDVALPKEGAEGRLIIESLSGQLVDFPLQGQGSLFFKQGNFEIDGLQLLTQNNQLRLDGSYSDTLDLSWSLVAESLDEFLAGSRGVLEGRGSIQGDPAAPDITGLLSGRNLSYQQFAADQFELEFQRLGEQVESELTVGTLTYTDSSIVESLSSIMLLVSGSEANHRIELNAQSRFGNLIANLSGGVSDLQAFSWQGSLEDAAVDTPVGSWSTRSATDLALGSADMTLGETCWIQENSTICFELEGSIDEGIAASGSLQNYPLSVFNAGQILNVSAGANLVQDQLLLPPQLPIGSMITGQAGGQFTLNLGAAEELRLDFSLASSDASLLVTPEQMGSAEDFNEDAPPQTYNLEVLKLSGDLQLAAWKLSAELGILRENLDDSEIDVRGEISANIGIAADNSLSGTINAGLEDLRWLQAIVPEFSNIEGRLNGQASLGGNFSAPEVTGSIDLAEASVAIDRLGITLSNITANVSSDNPESIQLIGRAQSDTGTIEFSGQVLEPFGGMPALSAEVRGKDFQLANVPNLQLLVSPSVVINADAASIEVIGSLAVPTLNLTLEQLPESAVDVSRDVVIVSYPNDRPDLARSIAATETRVFDLPLAGAIEITLGDDVTFTGFGMKAKLAGNLNVQQTASGSNRTYGELSIVEGTYEMYRQSLNISQGKFLFFGVYDNPGIDLRATREIEGFTAGVLMNGTLRNINSQLFSTPALADNDIIAVLVTGRPFSEMGQQDGDAVLTAIAKLGVGRSEGLTNQIRNKLGLDVLTVDPTDDVNNSVLTIGKYLTPDIFIRYGVGLFDSQSKVAVDYTLSERVKLQAESGEYQSVDIIYSVER